MKRFLMLVPLAFSACSNRPITHTASTPAVEPAAAAESVTDIRNLKDLEATVFDCPKAALNAAAREAAKAPTQGMYQFSYFDMKSDSHHPAYEVHFTSNYAGEPVLKYCVSVYCQQGWDPKTSKTTVELIGSESKRSHGNACEVEKMPKAHATGRQAHSDRRERTR